jgi:hypothetical protein
MAIKKLTGKAAYITVNGNRCEITKLKPSFKRELSKSTDSSNFNPADNQLYRDQQYGEVSLELDIEGNYDLNSTSPNLTAQLHQDLPVHIIGWLDQATKQFEGDFDLENVDTDITVPGAENVTFSTKAYSKGIYQIL